MSVALAVLDGLGPDSDRRADAHPQGLAETGPWEPAERARLEAALAAADAHLAEVQD